MIESLDTARLLLRPITADDVDLLVELDRDPAVMRFISGGTPSSRAEVQRIVQRSFGHRWIGFDKATEEFVGWFGLRPSYENVRELGYRLRQSAWGRGLATEGSQALIAVAFAQLGVERVIAQTMAVNTASRRVMERCGLRFVRTFHLEWDDPIEGTELGEVEYEITKIDWERRRAAPSWTIESGSTVARHSTEGQSMQLSDIDLLDRDRFTHGIPHEWFTFLRREAPVYKHPEPDGPGFWVVTKYADVVTVGRDGTTYSSDQARGGVVVLEDVVENDFEQGGNLMLTMDAPEHTRYRKLVNRGFTPRQIGALEDRIREQANRILDEVIERGECDFVVDVAAELPLQVIAEMLGVPQADRHKLFEWSNRMIGSEDPEYIVSAEEVQNAQIEMFMYANALAAERREMPRDDIVSTLLDAEVDGDRLSEMDFNLFFLLIAVAGNETTRNSISHGIRAFCDNPDQYQLLVKDPTLAKSATEEIVRWASPVMYFRRNVTRDTELGGQQLAEGDKVSIWYVSANRDEEVFDDPFTFDIRRSPNEHVGFGGGGPHHCLGANLARMEIYVLLEEMARRIPTVELAGEVKPLRSNFIGGIKHMPVKFPKGERES